MSPRLHLADNWGREPEAAADEEGAWSHKQSNR
jgi:hypothetical protein